MNKTMIHASEEEGGATITLSTLRREKGLSQFDLSLRARVHPSTISRIESGRYRPYPAEAKRLARALGVRVEDLFPEPAPSQVVERMAVRTGTRR